jgi:hypothetical protein
MVHVFLVGGAVASAVIILFVCLFVRFGQAWNGDLGGAGKRRR